MSIVFIFIVVEAGICAKTISQKDILQALLNPLLWTDFEKDKVEYEKGYERVS